MSLPVLVTRILLANALRVLILGTGGGLLGDGRNSCLPARREDHEQVLAFEKWLPFDDGELARVVSHPVENPSPDVLVDHLATSEHDRHFHIFACFLEGLQT